MQHITPVPTCIVINTDPSLASRKPHLSAQLRQAIDSRVKLTLLSMARPSLASQTHFPKRVGLGHVGLGHVGLGHVGLACEDQTHSAQPHPFAKSPKGQR